MKVKALIKKALGFHDSSDGLPWPAEATEADREIIRQCRRYTMTPRSRQWALLAALRYLDRKHIDGDIVECGVWKGGNMMLARSVSPERTIWLYDTFAGMTEPTAFDVTTKGFAALDRYKEMARPTHNEWCYASLHEVRENFAALNLDIGKARFVEGPVERTLANIDNLPVQIALLRLDTDWYASTKIELEILYPRVVAGGILIVDDYGRWDGARKAVDEYFGADAPFLVTIDEECRLAIKN